MESSKLRSFLINSSDKIVDEALEGLCVSNPGIRKIKDYRIVVCEPDVSNQGKVALISGGGAGHEPAHAGYVGRGMLSGAVSGHVFASPSSAEVLQGILQVYANNKAAGVLLIVTNYTGDRLNFGIAAERAKSMGIPVSMVIVGDDVALEPHVGDTNRRGLAGTVLIHKLAGALADEGHSLSDIHNLIGELSTNRTLATVNIALSSCQLPGSSMTSFDLDAGMAELGLGIHGEVGLRRIPVSSAKELVTEIFAMMIEPSGADNSCKLNLKPGERVALMVNNLGSCTAMEMQILLLESVTILEKRYQVNVVRNYVGNYMTSMNMAGASFTIFHIKDDKWIRYLDAPTSAPGWIANNSTLKCSAPGQKGCTDQLEQIDLAASKCLPQTGKSIDENNSRHLLLVLTAICQRLCSEEVRLNELDRVSGDGDCGSSHRRGAQAILNLKDEDKLDITHPARLLAQISYCLESSMGGTSGAIWSIFFAGASAYLSSNCENIDYLTAFRAGVSQVSRTGGAQQGDRSLLDALIPALISWEENKEKSLSDIAKCMAEASEAGSSMTSSMSPRVGRASYVGSSRVADGGSPDPGAAAVSSALRAVSDCVTD